MAMLAQLEATVMQRSPQARRTLIRTWYQYLSVLDRQAIMRFMNYGYSDEQLEAELLPLEDTDAPNRLAIQLYHHLAAALDLSECDMLEVGSGRGGGADYVARYLAPRSFVGLDFSPRAVHFCNTFYNVPSLRFVPGDAEALPFGNETFDIVLNIESSHCYSSMEHFLHEVARVLRPNGYFLFADHRSGEDVAKLREQLAAMGLWMIKDESIAANVVRALDLDHERKQRLIEQHAPPLIRKRLMRFAGLRGSPIYEALRTGVLGYRRCILAKSV